MKEQLALLMGEHADKIAPCADSLEKFFELLLEWNEKMDLTNVPPEQMAERHFADSLLPLFVLPQYFREGGSLIDVGTGAGFPGLPIAIARPDIKVTLLDSQRKRCDFLTAVKETLSLDNVTVLHSRAEDAARGALRERFDMVTARALAPLNVLSEYLLPFARVGGYALCWKGPALMNELEDGKRAVNILGGEVAPAVRMPIEGSEHLLQPLRKGIKTPKPYPRKAGTPSKQPL